MSAKLVMAIEPRKIDSGFGIGRGRSINGWEEIVDSNTLRCMTVILGSGEGIERVICMDPPLSKRICSTGQSSGEYLVMGFCINFKIPAILCLLSLRLELRSYCSKMIKLESHDTFCNQRQQ